MTQGSFSAPSGQSQPAGPLANEPGFSGLMPDVVLDALAAVGFEGDGRLTQLNSFENRVFQVMLTDGSAVVTKFYRPGRWSDEQIAEEHAFSTEAAMAEVPLVAPLPLSLQGTDSTVERVAAAPETLGRMTMAHGSWRFGVWPRRAGRSPELEDGDVLRRLGSCLARLHLVGARVPFAFRRSLRAIDDARAAIEQLVSLGCLPPDQQAPWERACGEALSAIAGLSEGWQPATLRLHGDCHPGNLLWREDGPNLVDLDDACNGPAVQDLWMLLSGEPVAAAAQLDALIGGYEQFRDFDRRELRLIEALRLARMVRHNAWIAQRWNDPAFPLAYPDFGSSSWWSQQAMQLREQASLAREMLG